MKKEINKQLNNQKGLSIIIVIIAAAIILIVGAVALVFASSNLMTTNKTIQDKNAYYVAKSVANVAKNELENGAAGQYIRDKVLTDLEDSQTKTLVARTKDWGTMDMTISLNGTGLSDYKVTDGNITFSSTATANVGSGASLSEASVNITNLIMRLRVTDSNNSNTYHLKIQLSYSGTYKSSGWTGEKWEVVNVSNEQ